MRIKHSKGDEPFKPIDDKNVRMYFCGPTVYDRVHIGNIRSFLAADLIFRVLKTKYEKVTYVRNITDIDDKIINKLVEENREFDEFVEEKINLFHNDLSSLNLLPPTIEPRATEHLGDMFVMIQTLIDRNYAYVSNGSVYFNIKKYPEGVNLFNRNITDKKSRTEINLEKTNNEDFALWKKFDTGVVWDSPWGKGRPGWHIECSAMAKKYLGEQFDIHGGGIDLQFPHHTNENTQSVCSSHDCKTEMAKYWVHSKMLNIHGKKMSKSSGEKIYISDLLDQFSPNIIRLYFFTTKYNEDFNFEIEKLKAFENYYSKILLDIKQNETIEIQKEDLEQGLNFLYDDFNVYPLMNYIAELSKKSNKDKSIAKHLLEIVGVDFDKIEIPKPSLDEEEITKLINQRNEYRINKNWEESDKIRNYLLDNKIKLIDTPNETLWSVI